MADESTVPPPSPLDADRPEADDLLAELAGLPTVIGHLVQDQVRLAGLELRLAGLSLVAMLIAALGMAALLVLAAIGLLASGGLVLLAQGLPAAAVLLLLAAVSVLLALLLRAYIVRRSADLGLPRTVLSLAAMDPPLPDRTVHR